VLVVEDDADIRALLADMLEVEGYHVIEAENGAVALEKLRAGARPAVLILDLMMPVMDGWQLQEELARDARFARIPTIVMSGAGGAKLRAIRADALFVKPVDFDVLLAAIERHASRAAA
jgi:CheY-like chemotaxis protein